MRGPSDAVGDELRSLLRGFPAGVAVLTVDADGERLGLTVGTVLSLSLEPPLVGVSVSRHAAMHELLRAAGGFGLSLLAGDGLSLRASGVIGSILGAIVVSAGYRWYRDRTRPA